MIWAPKKKNITDPHGFKNQTGDKTKFAFGSRFLPIFNQLLPVLGLFTRPD